jgi:hypothetical protein
MPVYLCQPGFGASEPWRHGIPVYAVPFPLLDEGDDGDIKDKRKDINAGAVVRSDVHVTTAWGGNLSSNNAVVIESPREQPSPPLQQQARHLTGRGGLIRRVRHSEVVLADDICIAYDRYWLRLIWPGHKGGFAGYVAMGKANTNATSIPWMLPPSHAITDSSAEPPGEYKHVLHATKGISIRTSGGKSNRTECGMPKSLTSSFTEPISGGYLTLHSANDETKIVIEEHPSLDDVKEQQEEEPQDTASMPPSEPFEESNSTLLCLRTGLAFSSSPSMKLMAIYDDGIDPPVLSARLPSEPVFCRICREGLHDVADEQQPTASVEDGQEAETPSEGPPMHSSSIDNAATGDDNYMEDDNVDDITIQAAEPFHDQPVSISKQGPVQPHPKYKANPHAAENPLLAPCECSGSMAFVHYLCVEQWRCRSRHPEARHGLQCETCGSPYALPPPSARPASVQLAENDDWLEAMPPHVMAALRRPHIWWQIGAAIVRRRWLRPIAPILMSPLVALYCRARRLLKKRGVARRRWACSLCRRRARWKCVRCLRSYYCSRQCQNVSWHIVHKHVCYKPARFWGSVIVYGVLTLLAFPGIVRDPLMYDLGLSILPMSFLVMGILGGGLATLLKKCAGMDIRGRSLEMAVVLLTLWLVLMSWGLVGAFFGDTNKCYGFLGMLRVSNDSQPFLLRSLRVVALQPARSWFLMWDRAAFHAGPWMRKALCTKNPLKSGCFEHLPYANLDFYMTESGGEKCASDLVLVSALWIAAGFALAASNTLKRRERLRRAAARRRHEIRPHQD